MIAFCPRSQGLLVFLWVSLAIEVVAAKSGLWERNLKRSKEFFPIEVFLAHEASQRRAGRVVVWCTVSLTVCYTALTLYCAAK